MKFCMYLNGLMLDIITDDAMIRKTTFDGHSQVELTVAKWYRYVDEWRHNIHCDVDQIAVLNISMMARIMELATGVSDVKPTIVEE